MFDLNQDDQMDLEESGPIQGDIWNAIVQISEEALVDARFILAIIMQEVRVPPCGLWCRFADVDIVT